MPVFFASDLHIGHGNCATRYRGFKSVEEHDAMLREVWLETVGKRDKVFVIGDVGHNKKKSVLEWYADLPGFKHLIMGNHDMCDVLEYRKVFDKVSGMVKYKDYWLTHAPIHPMELRGKRNIHGHLHEQKVRNEYGEVDSRYINANVDVNGYEFLSFEDIQGIVYG